MILPDANRSAAPIIGWHVIDLVSATMKAVEIVRREMPIISVITNKRKIDHGEAIKEKING